MNQIEYGAAGLFSALMSAKCSSPLPLLIIYDFFHLLSCFKAELGITWLVVTSSFMFTAGVMSVMVLRGRAGIKEMASPGHLNSSFWFNVQPC